MGSTSDFLFAMPSFISGVARTLDLGATFDSYNQSQTPADADQRALLADWKSVGNSLQEAMRKFEQDHPEPAQLSLALAGQ